MVSEMRYGACALVAVGLLIAVSTACPVTTQPNDSGSDSGATDDSGADTSDDPDQDSGVQSYVVGDRLWTDVVVGCDYSCGLTVDGEVVCSGDIMGAPEEGRFLEIAGDILVACAIDKDHRASCWGAAPGVPILEPPSDEFRGLSVGAIACAIRRSDDEPVCWGGATNPVLPGPAAQISTGQNPCVLAVDGVVVCDGPTPDGESESWVRSPNGTFVALSDRGSFWNHCGLREDGSVECWGKPETPAFQALVEETPSGSFVSVAMGHEILACALDHDGNVGCWGWDDQDVLLATPPQGLSLASVSVVSSACGVHGCGIDTDGRLHCWGDDDHGQSSFPGVE